MLSKHEGIRIPTENPFAEDCLDRKESAEVLANLIGTVHQPFVLSINGRWGMGKTTFVRMLKALLEKEGHQCLYFNAWESDFADDPFVALLGSIDTEIAEGRIQISSSPAAERAWQKTKTIGGSILRRATPLAIRIATHNFLNAETIRQTVDVLKGVEGDIASELEQYAKERIQGFELEKHAVDSFRRTLTDFSRAVNESKDTRGPVVIFVDELDRCRPSFAIQLLERIKHLFSVDGLLFVLSVDREQLAHSVRGLYGAGMNASGYLRRLIDLEYQLPEPKRRRFVFLLFKKLRIDDAPNASLHWHRGIEQLRESLLLSGELFALSLRDLEQCATALNVILRTGSSHDETNSSILAFLVALRASEREWYDDFVRGAISAEALIARLRQLPYGPTFFRNDQSLVIELYLHAMTPSDSDYQKMLQSYRDTTRVGQEAAERVVRARHFLERHADGEMRRSLRGQVFGRIELAEHFA